MKKSIIYCLLLCFVLCGCDIVQRPSATYGVIPTESQQPDKLLYPATLTYPVLNSTNETAIGIRYPYDESIFADESRNVQRYSFTQENLRMEASPDILNFPGEWYVPDEKELRQANDAVSRYITTLLTCRYYSAEDYAKNIEDTYDETLTESFAQSLRKKQAAQQFAELMMSGEVCTDISNLKNTWSKKAIIFKDGLLQMDYSIGLSITPDRPAGAVPHFFDFTPICNYINVWDTITYNNTSRQVGLPDTGNLTARVCFKQTNTGLRISEYYIYGSNVADAAPQCCSVSEGGVKSGIISRELPLINGQEPMKDYLYTDFSESVCWEKLDAQAKQMCGELYQLVITDYTTMQSNHFALFKQVASKRLAGVLDNTAFFENLVQFGRENSLRIENLDVASGKVLTETIGCDVWYKLRDSEVRVYWLRCGISTQCNAAAGQYGLPNDDVIKNCVMRFFMEADGKDVKLIGFDISSSEGDLCYFEPSMRRALIVEEGGGNG